MCETYSVFCFVFVHITQKYKTQEKPRQGGLFHLCFLTEKQIKYEYNHAFSTLFNFTPFLLLVQMTGMMQQISFPYKKYGKTKQNIHTLIVSHTVDRLWEKKKRCSKRYKNKKPSGNM